MPKVSVIIPVYNVEAYLKRCLESLSAQTLEDIEFILVNDGATDACPAMLDAFAAENPRARVIHKKNGGVSSARNAGLDVATGDYIGFVDSDDFIEPNTFQRVYEAAIQNSADMVWFHYASVWGDEAVLKVVGGEEKLFDGGKAAFSVQFQSDYKRFVWDKLFRRELFDGVRFPTDRVIYEDVFVLPQLFVRSSRVLQIPDVLYYYRARPLSLSHIRDEKLNQWLETADFLMDITRQNYPEFMTEAQAYYNLIQLRSLDTILECDHFRRHPCWKYQIRLLRKRLIPILKLNCPLVRKARKLYAIGIVLCPDLVAGYVRWRLRKNRRLLSYGSKN